MRFTTIAATLVVLLASRSPAATSELAPDWSLVSSTGDTVTLSDVVKDQTTVLFFWATWCPYCKALMPHLQSIRLEFGDDVEILAINFREDGDPIAYIRNAGYDFTVLPEGDAVAAVYGIHGTPGVIIVDDRQRIRFDLRKVPTQEPAPVNEKSGSHTTKAASRAPYWAAAIRKSIDEVRHGD